MTTQLSQNVVLDSTLGNISVNSSTSTSVDLEMKAKGTKEERQTLEALDSTSENIDVNEKALPALPMDAVPPLQV